MAERSIHQMQKCTKCEQVKALDQFATRKSRGTHYRQCRECRAKADKAWSAANRDKVKLKVARWAAENAERKRVSRRRWKDENKEKVAQQSRDWWAANREKASQYQRKRLATPQGRIESSVRARINCCLRKRIKSSGVFDILGYSARDLVVHLEKQFVEGMSWANYGKWHVDHIKPLKAFNYTSLSDPEFRVAWSLNNLQPLWAKDNLSKGAAWNEQG